MALEKHVYQLCLGSKCKVVAVREGLSYSTVKEIFNYWAALNETCCVPGATRVLGIDEISLKKRHKQFVLVISDIARKCILAVLPDREKKTLEQWMDGLSPQERNSIRFVSIDMWAPYYQAERNKLPHAQVVVDRFHLMKQLNARLTQLRTEHQKGLSPEMRSEIKGSRWILVRNRCELSPLEEEKLKEVLQLCPELRTLICSKRSSAASSRRSTAGTRPPCFSLLDPQSDIYRQQTLGQIRNNPAQLAGRNPQLLYRRRYQRICRGPQWCPEDDHTDRIRIQEFCQLQTAGVCWIGCFSR